jgi:hypothetical protein
MIPITRKSNKLQLTSSEKKFPKSGINNKKIGYKTLTDMYPNIKNHWITCLFYSERAEKKVDLVKKAKGC